jgi:hypothetical protein
MPDRDAGREQRAKGVLAVGRAVSKPEFPAAGVWRGSCERPLNPPRAH